MNDSWMEDFEHRLLKLEKAVFPVAESCDVVIQLALHALNILWQNPQPRFQIVFRNKGFEFAEDGLIEIEDWAPPEKSEQAVDWVHRSSTSETDPTAATLVCRSSLADDAELIIQSHGSRLHPTKQQAEEAVGAVAALVAHRATQYLLSNEAGKVVRLQELSRFSMKLQRCADLSSLFAVVVQESGSLWPNSRLAYCELVDGSHTVRAITGSSQINQQSAQVNALRILADERSATSIEQEAAPFLWLTPGQLKPVSESNESAMMELASDLQASGVHQIGIASFYHGTALIGTCIVELQSSVPPPGEICVDWKLATQAALVRATENSKSEAKWNLPSRVRLSAILFSVFVVLFFIPVDFELSVNGQLVAKGRQSVFSPETATVAGLHFKHEQPVENGTLLVTMTSPDLVLKLGELDGEISTTRAAIAAVNAQRSGRSEQGSAAEGQVLKQTLKNLQAERTLVDQRIQSLSVTSPMKGVVLRRNAVQDLTNRPLQRGQRIAELIPDDADWEIELYIPQSHSGYIQQALADHSSGLKVRYVLSSAAHKTHEASISGLERYTYNRNGRLIQNARGPTTLSPNTNAKSGTSVTARIVCGRRSLGFVATRKLTELLQYLKFVWWG